MARAFEIREFTHGCNYLSASILRARNAQNWTCARRSEFWLEFCMHIIMTLFSLFSFHLLFAHFKWKSLNFIEPSFSSSGFCLGWEICICWCERDQSPSSAEFHSWSVTLCIYKAKELNRPKKEYDPFHSVLKFTESS